MDEFNRKQIKIDQIFIEMAIVDTISSAKSKSDQNQRSNLAGLESKWLTIRCRTPNGISLVPGSEEC